MLIQWDLMGYITNNMGGVTYFMGIWLGISWYHTANYNQELHYINTLIEFLRDGQQSMFGFSWSDGDGTSMMISPTSGPGLVIHKRSGKLLGTAYGTSFTALYTYCITSYYILLPSWQTQQLINHSQWLARNWWHWHQHFPRNWTGKQPQFVSYSWLSL